MDQTIHEPRVPRSLAPRAPEAESRLAPLEQRLLDLYQRDFPLCPEPYAEMAHRLGVSEATVLQLLRDLMARGIVGRVGVVFRPGRCGASTLAAMAVPSERLEEVANLVSGFPEINHNYAREDALNLWFVVTAASQEHLKETLGRIATASNLEVHSMPMVETYHVDLGFRLGGH
ncbi:MAG: Lrp/AsnC family transcriptional regulator [Magnetococcales bacterium]|nr:Lrp/AsnC family transcriptional regulator [Magnetococcales bacterium]